MQTRPANMRQGVNFSASGVLKADYILGFANIYKNVNQTVMHNNPSIFSFYFYFSFYLSIYLSISLSLSLFESKGSQPAGRP
jgi:hypothetical protein